MPVEDFDALVRAARWTALSPYLAPACFAMTGDAQAFPVALEIRLP